MIKHANHPFTLASLAAAIAFFAGIGPAQAVVVTPLNLQKPPLFLNAAVDPNIAVTFDDSGSMESAFMPDSVDDNCSYRHPKFYSNVYNRIYYNPAISYLPPLKPDGTSFPNASFAAAWADGYEGNSAIVVGAGGSATANLATSYFPTRSMPARSTGNGTRITNRTETTSGNPTGGPRYTGAGSLLGCNATYGDNNTAWLPFATGTGTGGTSKAFYYRFTGTPAQIDDATQYVAVDMSAATTAEQQNFANWYSYYRSRTLMGRTAMTRVFGVQGQNLRVAFQNLNSGTFRFAAGTTEWRKFVDVTTPTAATPRTSFFQWLYREEAANSTPLRASAIRTGNLFKYGSATNTGFTNPYYEQSPVNRELTCRQNFAITLTDGFWNEGAPSSTGIVYDHVTRAFPDGFAYTLQPPYGNESSGTDLPSLADITFTYWATDLRTDLANQVPKYIKNPNAANQVAQYLDPENDPATWQHVVQYIVGLGVAGTRSFPGDYNALKAGTVNWPAPVNNTATAVDDSWHAALNSRGTYFSAADPDELVDSLSAVLQNVLVRRGTAAAATVTSGIIQASTLAFKTAFDSSDWSGQILAFNVDATGNPILPALWDTGQVLTARTSPRVILTASSASGGGIPFSWGSLPTAYQNALNDNPATVLVDSDGYGSQRVDYLRGDRSREADRVPASDTGPRFRIRQNLLGAVINSGAVVVAAPSAGYSDDTWVAGAPELAALYSEFRENNKARRRVVYVGANDGMLHAIDAGRGLDVVGGVETAVNDPGTGDEKWAYVPYEVAPSLSQLTNTNYAFTPYVDNSPTARDVFVSGAWRTMLVGSLRRGGQGVFALDITNPNITEANASTVVMWEFSDDRTSGIGSPRQLGFTYGKPNIARLAIRNSSTSVGKWVVLVPGSYNSDETDGNTGTGNSALFVLDAANGNIIRQFDLTGSKGLTTPTMGDYDDDFTDEFAVAGDLNGQMWRFDLSNESPSAWTVSKLWQPAVDGSQPITSAPRIFPDPATAGLIVVFGTGKYLEPSDRGLAIPTQALYGIRESGASAPAVTIGSLVQVAITGPDAQGRFRAPTSSVPTSAGGWFINLPMQGERDVTSAGAQFSTGLAIFSTIIPNGDDPCQPGLRGNIFILDAASGGAGSLGALTDTDGDGDIDANDDATVIGSAVSSTVAEGSPALLVNAGGGVGTLVDFPTVKVKQTIWRRRSWRELPNQ